MNESRLKNLINFSFLCYLLPIACIDSVYIIEKWNKYIGTTPHKNGNLDLDKLDTHNEFHQYLIEWVTLWGEKHYAEIKEILYFILLIRSVGSYQSPLKLSKLVELFEKNIGSLQDVNDIEYINLHAVAQNTVQDWLNLKENQREYKLLLLEI